MSVISDSFVLGAHRGGLFYRPENSLAAIRNSLKLGINWIELDIRLTRDKVPILIHDEQLDSSVGGGQRVRDLTFEQLSTIDVGGGERIPTLRQIMDIFASEEVYFDFDVKEIEAIDLTVKLILEYLLQDRVIITSFIPDALGRARDLSPDLKRGLLLDRLTGSLVDGRSAVTAARLLGCSAFLPDFRLLKKDWVEMAAEAGQRVIAWTINSVEDCRRVLELGVDGIISDRPDIFKAIVPK